MEYDRAHPNRIRIFFINCPTLTTDAATFLLLSQNEAQSTIQFEIHHFWLYSLKAGNIRIPKIVRWIADREDRLKRLPIFGRLGARLVQRNRSRLDLQAASHFSETMDPQTSLRKTKAIIDQYDSWVNNREANHYDAEPAPVIIVTESRFIGNYIGYWNSNDRMAIISMGGWKDFFRPGSALEYVLTSAQKFAIALCWGQRIGFHYPTRGCLFDYTIYIPDTRVGAFLGFLCNTCQRNLRAITNGHEYSDIESLIRNKWLGKREDTESITHILSRIYKYDLSKSIGLRPRLRDALVGSVQSEFGRFLWFVAIVILGIMAAVFVPSIWKLLALH